jgi:hypothetical protein
MRPDKDRLPIRLRLRPVQDGTKKLVEKYGDRPVAVRYRYDEYTRTRLKTVSWSRSQPWSPSQSCANTSRRSGEPAPSDRFGVRVGSNEVELRDRVKQVAESGARKTSRMWELTYAQIQAMGLEERIVQGG